MEEYQWKKMEVDFPAESEQAESRGQILNTVFPEKESILEKVKRIYLGPGLKVIFYHCEGSMLVSVLLYLSIALLSYLIRGEFEDRAAVSMVVFPVCFFVFSYLSCFVDEQEEIIELKNSLHYSVAYLLILRMFYAGIIMIFGNLFLLFFVQGFHGQKVWSLLAVGVSSMFLFAGISAYLYHKFGRSLFVGLFFGIWVFLAQGIMRFRGEITNALIFEVPLTVHFLVAAAVLAGFIIYIRKVEKRDAYAFAH